MVISSTCSSQARAVEASDTAGEYRLGAALTWKAWHAPMLQQIRPTQACVSGWLSAETFHAEASQDAVTSACSWSPSEAACPCTVSATAACRCAACAAACGPEIGKIAMVIASSATMMVPISRKGGKLLFVGTGYVSRKSGFDKRVPDEVWIKAKPDGTALSCIGNLGLATLTMGLMLPTVARSTGFDG